MPYSRTCATSWPALRKPPATNGDKELSTRNFNDRSLVEVHVRARLQQQIAKLRGCLRAQDLGTRQGSRRPSYRPPPSLQSSPRVSASPEYTAARPFAWD